MAQVVGKTKPVRIFFLFGDESVASTEAFAALAFAHGSMIAAYRGREWAEALAQLEVCRNQAPDILRDFYQLYEERIGNLVASPPPPAWDGVFEALTK
jgi:adenylate cyclase